MLHVKKTLFERTAFHTGQPVEQIEKDADRDRWYTAEEAREYGFVDAIAETFAQLMPARKRPFGLRPTIGATSGGATGNSTGSAAGSATGNANKSSGGAA